MKPCDVLIAGAGPTGLVLALWLTKQGVSVRIIDKTEGPGTTSRALAVQTRTLELYRQLDLTEAVLARGHRTPAVNLWVKGRPAAHMAFGDIGVGMTPYPFLHIFPQDEHEALLIERLLALGVAVERRTELLGFEDTGDGVRARLRQADGGEETCEARYVAGCDGAHSIVRQTLGAGYPGGTYRQLFYVADIEGEGPPVDGELHIDLDQADFLAVFPLTASGHARLIGTVRDARADHPETLKFEDVSSRAIDNLKLTVRQVNWFSTYRVHHRVTDRFRGGRAFLLGDAAHIHSPAGGQGMNTGIGDAINLAWKLAAVLDGRAQERLLDSYQAERMAFARRLVATTDKVFSFATAAGGVADFLRTRVAPLVIPAVAGSGPARTFLFRTIGQTNLNYRGGPISLGKAGRVQGGDRLPWVSAGGQDNFEPLAAMIWQAHVYGAASGELTVWCAAQGLPLHVFEWRPEHATAGLQRGAVYLLRPDTYVALADPSGSPAALERYAAGHQLSLGAAGSRDPSR
jgi:2-polyprenyl-6-methoxyphenol hydroxylase-like FAD-dependent oxidoreductase